MMREIYLSDIKSEQKKGKIVAVEFQPKSSPFAPSGEKTLRALVQDYKKNSESVETIYGAVFPTKVYSFDKIAEAQKFLNQVSV